MSAQLENGYIRIANEIWDEIIRRDFTKRQKDILLLILRLSYGCRKKVAIIPKLKHFAVCGISPTQIASELKHLRECKVIDWNKEHMEFSFNKNYEYWQVSPVKGWDSEIFGELVHINLQKTSQNMNFTKHELHEKRSQNFMKSEVEGDLNPRGSKAEDVSKDSIKDTQEEEGPKVESEPKTAQEAYVFAFKKGVQYTGYIRNYVTELLMQGFTDAFIRELFLEMGQRGIGPDERYMRKLATDWISKGIYTRVEAQRRWQEQNGTTTTAYASRSEKEAAIQQRLADERKNEIVEYFVPEFEAGIKEAAAGYDTSTGRSASVL